MSKIFCTAPFVSFSTTTQGNVRLCCQATTYKNLSVLNNSLDEIWNSEEYNNARFKFVNGEWPNECLICKRNEDNGIPSRRQYENEIWKHLDVNDIIETPRIYGYDLRMGHTCNLKCIMCTPINSSLWVAEHMQFEHLQDHITHSGHKWANDAELLDDVINNMQSVERLYFSGGEPLLIKKHEELIRYCVKNGYAPGINLIYDTNATQITKKWIDLWENFKNVQINFSIDGGHEVVEYVRFPVKYDTLINSLELLKNSNIDVNLQMAVGAYNIFEVDNILELRDEYKCKGINISILNWPDFMSLDNLTDEQKIIVKEKYKDYDHVKRIKMMVENLQLNNNNPTKLKEYFEKIDKVRDLDYRKVFKWL